MEDVEFYTDVAKTSKKRARILVWYGGFLVFFSIGMLFFVRWALIEDLITLRFIRGTFPELTLMALPFTALGAYVGYSARELLREAAEEIGVLKKALSKKEDELERLRRIQTS